jgi:hypothetical protein
MTPPRCYPACIQSDVDLSRSFKPQAPDRTHRVAARHLEPCSQLNTSAVTINLGGRLTGASPAIITSRLHRLVKEPQVDHTDVPD